PQAPPQRHRTRGRVVPDEVVVAVAVAVEGDGLTGAARRLGADVGGRPTPAQPELASTAAGRPPQHVARAVAVEVPAHGLEAGTDAALGHGEPAGRRAVPDGLGL